MNFCKLTLFRTGGPVTINLDQVTFIIESDASRHDDKPGKRVRLYFNLERRDDRTLDYVEVAESLTVVEELVGVAAS